MLQPAPHTHVLRIERRVHGRFRALERVHTSRSGRYRVALSRAGVYRVRYGAVTGPVVRVR
jgi:inactivated superfamily I helicase